MRLCFATNNAHKLEEVRAILPVNFNLLSLTDVGCLQELPETNPTLEGNAQQKASFVHRHYQVDCFADDTGLEVEALNGAPGVYSARYAGPERNDQANCAKLLQALKHQKNKNARFRTVICLILRQQEHFFEGVINGRITGEPKGDHGFGYDPIFIPEGSQRTFAEMPLVEKNELSHRARAVSALNKFLMSIADER
mgnify:FL=1